jgi:hypothetical protein
MLTAAQIQHRAISWTNRSMRLIYRQEYKEITKKLRELDPASKANRRTYVAGVVLKKRHPKRFASLYVKAHEQLKEQHGYVDQRKLNSGKKPIPRPTLQFECPRCLSPAGEACKSHIGRTVRDHLARVELARRQDAA